MEPIRENIAQYFSQADLVSKPADVAGAIIQRLASAVPAKEAELSYLVPLLTPDGTCSMGDELAAEPYDLRVVAALDHLDPKAFSVLVGHAAGVVAFLCEAIGADWTGIYKKMTTGAGPALVKLAYDGRPSRAEFPLTEAFAAHSNNSTVGLSGKGVIVQDVGEYIEAGGAYYECDANVRSEICLPVFSAAGEVIGIIDLESFQPNFFTSEKITIAAVTCVHLGSVLV